MNRWRIPPWLEEVVVARDTSCIYCRSAFAGPGGERRLRRSWEHIVNDESLIKRENIALCCIGCNASKGTKSLSAWLESKYCHRRGISAQSIAAVAQAELSMQLSTDRSAYSGDIGKLPMGPRST